MLCFDPLSFTMVHPRPLVSNLSGGLEMDIGAPCEGLPGPFELPGLKVLKVRGE
jgi:hypothetical protein